MVSAAVMARDPYNPYKAILLGALLVASFLPAVLSVINFEITNQSIYAITFLFSLLLILGGAHVWLTLAYYFDPVWMRYFLAHPREFILAPLAILVTTLLLLLQPSIIVAQATLYGTTFVNLWHHSKQNWGILSIVAKIRGGSGFGLRVPLVYAWPFFLVPWLLVIPDATEAIGEVLLYYAGVISVAAYILFFAVMAWRAGFFVNRDPVLLLFGFALALYFVPIVALKGKPYSLAIWAVAHALQYYIIVAVSLSMRRVRSIDLAKGIAGVTLVALILGILTYVAWLTSQVSTGTDIWSSLTARVVLGIVTGVNLIHFWLDAFIWKFSSKDVRQLHGEAFSF